MQAGKYGIPILSLNVDPDDFINHNKCGWFANGDFDNFLLLGFKNLISDYNFWKQCSQNIRKYVKFNHSIDVIDKKWQRVLENVL